MSNSTNETLSEKGQSDGKISNNQRTEPSQEWETMAQAWVAAFPDANSVVSATEVETWIGSNFDSLPADLRQRPLSDLVDRFLSMQQYMRQTASEQNEQESQADQHPARFQRTDQWLPVYSWLEYLDSGERGLIRLSRETAMEVHKEFGEKHHNATLSADPMSNIPKDSDLYRTKLKEAKRRFEILVELEKKLAPHFSRPRITNT
uniref:Uncharacterized protein n=1 Tax=Brassica campestris TaxID=3711 RepID=M4E166_BRACM